MCAKTQLKTFVNPNHKVLETDFNLWTDSLKNRPVVVNSTLTYSAALQKFVLAVIYTTGGCQHSQDKTQFQLPFSKV